RLVEGALIPSDAQPAHAQQNALDHFGGGTFKIGVLNPQDHGTANMPRVEPVEQCGARSAYVQIAGGRGCKADANWRWRAHNLACFFCITPEPSEGGERKKLHYRMPPAQLLENKLVRLAWNPQMQL